MKKIILIPIVLLFASSLFVFVFFMDAFSGNDEKKFIESAQSALAETPSNVLIKGISNFEFDKVCYVEYTDFLMQDEESIGSVDFFSEISDFISSKYNSERIDKALIFFKDATPFFMLNFKPYLLDLPLIKKSEISLHGKNYIFFKNGSSKYPACYNANEAALSATEIETECCGTSKLILFSAYK